MLGEILATGVRKIFLQNATLADLFRRSDGAVRVRHLEDD